MRLQYVDNVTSSSLRAPQKFYKGTLFINAVFFLLNTPSDQELEGKEV